MYLLRDMLNGLAARFEGDDEGQGLAEYALIMSLIAIVAIVGLVYLGGAVSKLLSNVGTAL